MRQVRYCCHWVCNEHCCAHPSRERNPTLRIRIVDAPNQVDGAQAAKAFEASSIMERRFIADQNDVEVASQMREQSGDAACSAMARRIDGKRRGEEKARTNRCRTYIV